MIARPSRLLLALALTSTVTTRAEAQAIGPDTVRVRSGEGELSGLFWRPSDGLRAPALLFLHGSPRPADTEAGRLDGKNHDWLATALGPLFAGHGYALLFLHRRGCGLSASQGTCSGDLLSQAETSGGQEARNRVQLELLEGVELDDALSGLAWLRSRSDIDPDRVAVAGHSFGGSLALLVAESDTMLRAVIDFAGGAKSWENSPPLRARLLTAVDHATAPIFFIQAENDYSMAPTEELSAEMARLERSHQVGIFPPVGTTAEDGHAFVRLGIATWESDVFRFLDEHMRR